MGKNRFSGGTLSGQRATSTLHEVREAATIGGKAVFHVDEGCNHSTPPSMSNRGLFLKHVPNSKNGWKDETCYKSESIKTSLCTPLTSRCRVTYSERTSPAT